MGNYTPKKATFTVEGQGKKRVFHAVNKRAHTVCKKAGKRSKLTYEQLKALKGTGTYRYFVYEADGTLKPVRF